MTDGPMVLVLQYLVQYFIMKILTMMVQAYPECVLAVRDCAGYACSEGFIPACCMHFFVQSPFFARFLPKLKLTGTF